MKIIMAVKQVPVRDSVIHIDSTGKWLQEQDLSFEINEPDGADPYRRGDQRTIPEKATFLKTAPRARGELLRYEQWNIDERSVVSFAGVAFRKGVSSG